MQAAPPQQGEAAVSLIVELGAPVHCVAASAGGGIAAGCDDGVHLLAEGRERHILQGIGPATAICAAGRCILAAGSSLRSWDVETRALCGELKLDAPSAAGPQSVLIRAGSQGRLAVASLHSR